MTEPADVARALLGRWPNQVAQWGKEGIAAYLAELEAEGVAPDRALVGIRMHRSEYPPSVGEVSDNARRDPDRPTFDELIGQLYGPGGVFGFKRSGVTISPWVTAFVRDVGGDWLHGLPVDDLDQGKWARRDIQAAWERFLQAAEGREVAALVGRRRGELGKPDLLKAIGAGS